MPSQLDCPPEGVDPVTGAVPGPAAGPGRPSVPDVSAVATRARMLSGWPSGAPGGSEGEAFWLRVQERLGDALGPLHVLYGSGHDITALAADLVARAARAAAARPPDLQVLDRDREIRPDWFQRPSMLGYVAYAERFAGTLAATVEHIDYLRELGVTYLHLMSVIRPRPGPNDGGFAVADYRSVDPLVGTMDDLVQLRRDIFDGLEEYYGTQAKTHGYTAEATARGEALFGIDDLFESVVDRLEALTFAITPRSQQSVSRLGFWLTTSFGAIETGFVAASIATWYYASNLWAVLGWTIGVTLATALVISSLLRWRLKP